MVGPGLLTAGVKSGAVKAARILDDTPPPATELSSPHCKRAASPGDEDRGRAVRVGGASTDSPGGGGPLKMRAQRPERLTDPGAPERIQPPGPKDRLTWEQRRKMGGRYR